MLYDYFRAPGPDEVRDHLDDRQRSTDLVGLHLIWPEGGDQDGMHEGPWVCVLDDRTRDTLTATPADRIPDLAERWSTAEEFGGHADRAHLRE